MQLGWGLGLAMICACTPPPRMARLPFASAAARAAVEQPASIHGHPPTLAADAVAESSGYTRALAPSPTSIGAASGSGGWVACSNCNWEAEQAWESAAEGRTSNAQPMHLQKAGDACSDALPACNMFLNRIAWRPTKPRHLGSEHQVLPSLGCQRSAWWRS